MLRLLWIFPIDQKKILFFSFDGMQYSDSPKYLSDRFAKESFSIFWAFKDKKKFSEIIDKKYTAIKFGGISFLWNFVTSKVIVTNDFVPSYLPVREKQIFLNTWHGGSPLKTVGKKDRGYTTDDELFFKLHERKYTAFLSSSEFMSNDVFDKSFGFKGEVIASGMPRNDLLFLDRENSRRKVYEYFRIPQIEDKAIVLYAPTFRGKDGFLPKDVQLNIKDTVKTLSEKFGKDFIFLFRAHHAMKSCLPLNECCVASDYPDMQELLHASDVLITDYSSCMGDFALMKKPVFLYAPDLDEYVGDRGFYWDIRGLPFPLAETQKELEQVIKEFEIKKYVNGVNEYHDKLGSFERGESTEIAYHWIRKKLGE